MTKITEFYSKGSYIVIEPISNNGNLYKGKLYFKTNKDFTIKKDSELYIYYLEKDINIISYNDIELHVMLYYNIVFCEEHYIDEIIKEKKLKKNNVVEFDNILHL